MAFDVDQCATCLTFSLMCLLSGRGSEVYCTGTKTLCSNYALLSGAKYSKILLSSSPKKRRV